MRNEAMEQLDALVGSWRTTMRNAWFLEPADREVPGSATVEWLGDAVVVFRWTMGGDVGPATSEMVRMLAGRGELVVLAGSGHLLSEAALELRERLLVWLPETLAAPAPA